MIGPANLERGLWDEFALAQAEIPEWQNLGTYNPASKLPSGAPSDHAVYPAAAFDAGFDPHNPASVAGAELFASQMIGRPGIHYVIVGNKIWSTERGLHDYTFGGHESHVHVSAIRGGVLA